MKKALKVIISLQIFSAAFIPFAVMAAVVSPPNPAFGILEVQTLLGRAADWIFTIIISLAALVMLIGAFNILTAGGDATKVTAGRNWIVWGIVGVVVAILARAILTLACNFVFGACPVGF